MTAHCPGKRLRSRWQHDGRGGGKKGAIFRLTHCSNLMAGLMRPPEKHLHMGEVFL